MAKQPVISQEVQPMLEGIPANNRIFVDGKAHEVFYIDETAVIERNQYPHRVYFAGPPRNVIIDGTAHLLHFGRKKMVCIDEHIHTIRFGSPSKELYMGNYAFKGQFGGAPIIAIIDNVRHEIRLSGLPPEVKIDPDPAYDLARFMINNEQAMSTHRADFPSQLLRHLKEKGYSAATVAANTAIKNEKEKEKMKSTPPIPSEHTYDSVERKIEPPTSLRDFNMGLYDYQGVIDKIDTSKGGIYGEWVVNGAVEILKQKIDRSPEGVIDAIYSYLDSLPIHPLQSPHFREITKSKVLELAKADKMPYGQEKDYITFLLEEIQIYHEYLSEHNMSFSEDKENGGFYALPTKTVN